MDRPTFKRGARGVRVRYVKVGPKAGQCFVNLVESGLDYIKFSYDIACAMSDKPLDEGWLTVRGRRKRGLLATVSPRYATLYRRAFDGLGLVEDIPGEWNPEVFENHKFDVDSIDDGYNGYGEFSDWSDLNYPAELYLRSTDTDSYRMATQGYEVFVLSRNLGEVDGYDNKGVAYGDIETTRSEWFLSEMELLPSQPGSQERIGGVQTHRDNTTILYPCKGTELAHPPATVLLVKRNEVAWKDRRSRSGNCLIANLQRPVSVPELVELTGTPRRTVYDRISKGKAIKINDGQYWCTCHPLG